MDRDKELIAAFAAELIAQRKKACLSQEALAHSANVNRTYIAKLETEKNQPTLCVLHDLAEALGTNLPSFIQSIYDQLDNKQKRAQELSGRNFSMRRPSE